MKKLLRLSAILACMAAMTVATFSTAPTKALGQMSEAEEKISQEVFELFKEFVTENPERTTGTQGEADAAQWLTEKSQSMGYSPVSQQFPVAGLSGYVDGSNLNNKSQNIVATLDNPNTDKSVIIGAHYDNVSQFYYHSSTANGSHGALDNGSGVAVVLSLMQALKTQTLDFDVQFVFFGAEEVGLVGANYFVSQLSQAQKDNIISMFNIDSVATGDHLYVWGEDRSNPQEKFVSEKSMFGTKVQEAPGNMRTIFQSTTIRPYYNLGHPSDHMSFLSQSIPVAFLFSGNLSSNKFGYVENQDKEGIMHTASDSLDVVLEYENLQPNLTGVATTLYTVITSTDFADEMADARKYIIGDFWLNPMNGTLILAALLAVAGLLAYRHHRKLLVQSALGGYSVAKRTVYEKPDEEDIFTFKD